MSRDYRKAGITPRRQIVWAADSGIELVTIPNVELMDVGEDWETSTGVFTFTSDDLQSACDALKDPSVRTPVLKFGHTDPRFDGDFSIGRVENLTITNNGQTLCGDYVGVPKWLAEIMASAYPRRSIEGRYDWETYTGNRWPFYLTAVALLGASYPAIATIEDIKAFWQGDPVEMVEVAASADPPYLVKCDRGIVGRVNRVEGSSTMKWRKGGVEAAVEVDDIRRTYYDQLEASQMWWWIRAIQIDPPQLIVDDDDGSLYRVGYKTSGDEVTFEDPVKVKVEYVDVPTGKKAAASAEDAQSWGLPGMVAAYPTREASRGATVTPRATSATPEDTMTPEQKALIGLPADADDAAVNAKLTELAQASTTEPEPDPDKTATPANPGTSQPAGPAGPPPTPDPEPATKPDEGKVDVPEGMVLVDASTWEQVKSNAIAAGEKMATDEKARRKGIVDAALKEGKFPRSRREHYDNLMASDDPKVVAATESLIAAMEPGLIPVGAEKGTGDGDVDANGNPAEAYPAGWLPEVVARGNSNGRPPTIVTEA